MRRKDREIEDKQEMEEIISRAKVCRLAMSVDDQPYLVPLNFGYAEGKVYFHSAKEGRKLEMIAANDKVCFEVDLDHDLISASKACKFGFGYASVIGFGRAAVVEDRAEKELGLKTIMAQYSDDEFEFSAQDMDRVAVVRVELTSLSGKRART